MTFEELQKKLNEKVEKLPPAYADKVGLKVPKPKKTKNPNEREFYDYIPWYILTYADDIHKLVDKMPEVGKTVTIVKYGLKTICYALEKLAKYYRVT